MNRRFRGPNRFWLWLVIAVAVVCGMVAWTLAASAPPTAEEILNATGVKGGLVVHLGCGDGRLTAALRANESFLVHGLATDPATVARARKQIRSQGSYGPVSADTFDGTRLPYSDGTVNLLVAERLGKVTRDEIMRVLAPNGVAYLQRNRSWTKTAKPRPADIDEWTHYLHDSTGNAVSSDSVVGPPRRLQWVGSPRWARSHEHTASLNALVSANGRIFYIMDEGPKASIQLPPHWVLAARDAFSGVVLWKRQLPNWHNHLFPLKSGPARLTRRLVAVGDEVYTTLGINAPLSAIDAATGETLRTYEDTATVEELVVTGGVLFLVVNPDRKPVDYQQENANCWPERDRASKRWGWDETVDRLMAVEAQTGRILWQRDTEIVPMSLAADGERVVYHDGEAVVCLEHGTGEQLWRTEVARNPIIPTGWSPSVVMYEDVVLTSFRKRALVVLAVSDGRELWNSELHPSGHLCPEDVLVVDGLVWSGDIASGANKSTGVFTGRDPRTGDVEREFLPDTNPFAVMHQRCYPSKATGKYLIPSWIGTEFVDPRAQTWEIHHWVRGGCFYGMMPCNGLLYAPPHACACYYQSKLRGFNALAPPTDSPLPTLADADRLQRGPAYRKTARGGSPEQGDWPTYRHDPLRSGCTQAALPTELKPAWETALGGRLTTMTVGAGRLFVAGVDEHTVYALDSRSGNQLWAFTAGGRVDSPPTVHGGAVLFGSADGCVYCLRAADGKLAWRFRVAPADRRIVAFEQVESAWPVHGSVLVMSGPAADPEAAVAYCLAGRSMFLDGGMRLVRLDVRTGRKLSETVLDDKDPATGENLQSLITGKKMPVALPDVLSSDGECVYMRSQRFNLDGQRAKVEPERPDDQEGNRHVFSPIGMLDDSWFHRAYMIYGKNAGEGWGEWFVPGRLVPYGRVLVVGEDTVFAYGRHPWYLCNSSVLEYRLYAAHKQPAVPATAGPESDEARRGPKIPRNTTDWSSRSNFPIEALTKVSFRWVKEQPPLLARAMVLADETLLVAGPPDVDDEHAGWGQHLAPDVAAAHQEQAEALEGGKGGLLWVVSAADGDRLAEYSLESPPVFDGMVTAGGSLYIATTDGKVVCWREG